MYAFIDTETTGFLFNKTDRIIEIAVLLTDDELTPVEEFVTLINPKRDVGPTKVHGISARDVFDAPTFEQVCPMLISMLKDRVVVGHNVIFDLRFIFSELQRLSIRIPNIPYLCTLSLSRDADVDSPSRKLEELCRYFGISFENRHSAFSDTMVTYELFKKLKTYQNLSCVDRYLKRTNFEIISEIWPETASVNKINYKSRGLKPPPQESTFYSKLVLELPMTSLIDRAYDPYFSLLDKVLEDGILDDNEIKQLTILALELGLGLDDVDTVHSRYLELAVETALQDGQISKDEEAYLIKISELLGISTVVLDSFITSCKILENNLPIERTPKVVCFSGESLIKVDGKELTRNYAESMARDLGIEVKSSVTKKVDTLVLSDAYSQSSKAKKAREFGIRIVEDSTFWTKMGKNVCVI